MLALASLLLAIAPAQAGVAAPSASALSPEAAASPVSVTATLSKAEGTVGQPFTLELTGPAGGSFTSGSGGESIELDAVEFCCLLAGRGEPTGLLRTIVPF